MGRVVLGVVGAVVGGVIDYYSGNWTFSSVPQGFAIGYGVGAATESKPGIEGPRLSDLRFTSSSYGQPIPWIRGSPRVSGQIVWASQKREISTTSSQGKGGGQESTSFTYEMDVLVLLCDHEAAAVSRIWSNGKLVWTRRSDASSSSLAASDGSNLWRRLVFYKGDAGQLPDPTYEAAVGLGNAPAYRGRATLMIEGLQLGGSGQLPNLTFEVSRLSALSVGSLAAGPTQAAPFYFGGTAASASTTMRVPIPQWDSNYSTQLVRVYDFDLIAKTVQQVGSYNHSAPSIYVTPAMGSSDDPALMLPTGTLWTLHSGVTGTPATFTVPISGARQRFCRSGATVLITNDSSRLYKYATTGGAPLASTTVGAEINSLVIIGDQIFAAPSYSKVVWVFDLDTLTLKQTIPRPSVANGNADYYPWLFDLDGSVGMLSRRGNSQLALFAYRQGGWVDFGAVSESASAQGETAQSICIVGGLLVCGNMLNNTPSIYRTFSAPLTVGQASESIKSVVEAICERSGMPTDGYDASALSSITREVRSLALTSGGARGTLEQLGSAFFFNACLRDKIYFRPRGASPVVSIPWTDLAAKADQADDETLELVVGNDLELPPQIAVSYINVDDDAQAGTEYSDRMTGGQTAVQTISLGIGMKPAEAKGIADVAVVDAAAALVSSAISLPITYARLDPADVVEVIDRDSRSYRFRLMRKRDERGVLSFDVVGDDASALTSAQITDGTQVPASEVTKAGDTIFQPLDSPLLRDADNTPGWYVVAKGTTPVWPGGVVLTSSNGADFTTAAEVNESAVYGVCTSTLGDFSGVGFDEVNALTVNVGNGELASSTRDTMLGDQTVNAMLVGDEVIRFRTATMTGAGVYVLTGLLRGQKGTEWAMAGHAAAERCVVLRARGMRRVAQQASENGQLRYLRAGTLGSTVLPATTNFTNTNRGLKPLSPQGIRGQDSGAQDLILTWRRRSRLSAAFLSPSGLPLGESEEKYVVRIYSGSTLLRTMTASLPTATYTRAQQVSDGINTASVIRVDVAQVSALVGEGYVGSANINGVARSLAQVYEITLGGSFQAGVVIRAALSGTTVDYTTVSGDTNLAGAAASLAAAIDATANYSATSVASKVYVAGSLSTVYSAQVFVLTAGAGMAATTTQTAVAASPGTQYIANLFATNLISGKVEPVPLGTTFGVSVLHGGSEIGYFSFTTTEPSTLSAVHSGLASAFDMMFPPLKLDGYLYGPTIVSGVWAGLMSGPVGTVDVGLSTNASSGYSMAVSVQQPGSAAVPTALPQKTDIAISGTPMTGWVYRATLGSGNFDFTATASETTAAAIAAQLAAVIDADADYLATAAGAVITVERASAAVPFTYAVNIISSTLTASGAVTQQAI